METWLVDVISGAVIGGLVVLSYKWFIRNELSDMRRQIDNLRAAQYSQEGMMRMILANRVIQDAFAKQGYCGTSGVGAPPAEYTEKKA